MMDTPSSSSLAKISPIYYCRPSGFHWRPQGYTRVWPHHSKGSNLKLNRKHLCLAICPALPTRYYFTSLVSGTRLDLFSLNLFSFNKEFPPSLLPTLQKLSSPHKSLTKAVPSTLSLASGVKWKSLFQYIDCNPSFWLSWVLGLL